MAGNSSSSSNFTSDDHRTRQAATQQEQANEHDSGSQAGNASDAALSRRLLSGSGSAASANSSLRASSMQAMQQTHGNRAVQRFVQRSADKSASAAPRVSVQRESDGWGPAWDQAAEDKKLQGLTSDVYNDAGDWNVLQAIPALGNVVSAAGGILNLGAAGVSKIMGDDKVADREVSNAGYDFLHAVPFLGNYLAGRDASRDFDNGDKALAGDKSVMGTPGNRPLAETSQDKFQNTGVWDYIKGNF